jgi:hypothetical protein
VAAADWAGLERELDAWGAADRTATLWWRDDDAVSATAELDRLLALADGVPVALAVIPARAADSLARRVAACSGIRILQHGWTHTNHAPPPEKKAELGAHRPNATMLSELATGWRRLTGLFGGQAMPVLTPPWNRMSRALIPLLSEAGFAGLSTVGARQNAEPSPGLRQVNAHADLVAWRAGSFIGTEAALRLILGHLAARRAGTVDPVEPTGLLTHHLILDGAGEAFLSRLVARTRGHPAARWLGTAEAFGLA